MSFIEPSNKGIRLLEVLELSDISLNRLTFIVFRGYCKNLRNLFVISPWPWSDTSEYHR